MRWYALLQKTKLNFRGIVNSFGFYQATLNPTCYPPSQAWSFPGLDQLKLSSLIWRGRYQDPYRIEATVVP